MLYLSLESRLSENEWKRGGMEMCAVFFVFLSLVLERERLWLCMCTWRCVSCDAFYGD